MRMMLALLLVAITGCAAPPHALSPSATTTASIVTSASPATTSASQPSSLVGEWLAEHRCEDIVRMLTEAGRATDVLDTVAGNGLVPGATSGGQLDPSKPCDKAVPRAHSHLFSADGRFASYDWNHQRVDDGTYTVVDDDTVEINGTTFVFHVEGDALTLSPDGVNASPEVPTSWPLMVALPGTTWKRVS